MISLKLTFIVIAVGHKLRLTKYLRQSYHCSLIIKVEGLQDNLLFKNIAFSLLKITIRSCIKTLFSMIMS